jgi:hypothetical protein
MCDFDLILAVDPVFEGATLAADVLGERCLFHAAVNSCLLESFERRCLGVGQSWLGSAFRERPTSVASLNQQEFDFRLAHAIANRGDLFACAQFSKPRKTNELSCCTRRSGP